MHASLYLASFIQTLCFTMCRSICLLTIVPLASSFSTIHQSATSPNYSDVSISIIKTISHHSISQQRSTYTRIYSYGKGSEIWPPTNEEPVRLASSFPGGVIPQPAQNLLDFTSSSTATSDMTSEDAASTISSTQTTIRGHKRRAVRATLSHLLRSAAIASSRRARSTETVESEYADQFGVPHTVQPAISKGPAILALILLATNCVNPQHLLSVIGMSIYFIGLASWCAAPKRGMSTNDSSSKPIVNMPTLPVKGHVPILITNPLGASLTNSSVYRIWLRVGALLGVLLPTLVLAQLTMGSKLPVMTTSWLDVGNHVGEIKRIVGGPMFLLCCQALTEAVARTALLPLPIRILIPVSYNTIRLSSLHSWAFSSVISTPLRVLGIANLFYWYANLLLFLILLYATYQHHLMYIL